MPTKVTLELPADAAAKILADPEAFKAYAEAAGIGDILEIRPHASANIRTEFGFSRTVCDCKDCTINCRFIPGYLLPDDLIRIAEKVGAENITIFAERYLLASPGAVVGCSETGQRRQIRTLVPARRDDGACIFLKADKCTIHEVSPFGCAFFDAHQPGEESNRRSIEGLMVVDAEWGRQDSLYAALWLSLFTAGRVAPHPMEARARMKAAMAVEANRMEVG